MENLKYVRRAKVMGNIDLVAGLIHFCYAVADISIFFKEINDMTRTGIAITRILVLVAGIWLSYMLIESSQKETITIGNRYAQVWFNGKAAILGFYLFFFITFFTSKYSFKNVPVEEYRHPIEAAFTWLITIVIICLVFPYIKELKNLRNLEKEQDVKEKGENSKLLNQ
ncbi:unnamed protein product [Orchesella dallaii]|uniref:Uncharacterized protein n=1 Tax=Orchesella dallaii TaxID=48710 RepID=A0ABP1RIH7_9HEXA